MKKWLQAKENILLLLGLLLVAGTHLYLMGQVPFGINVDEAGSCYDAYCLANFGTDRYLHSYPVYFINYGGGQNALFTYLLVPFFKFGGYSLLYPRIVMALASLVAAWAGMKLCELGSGKSLSGRLYLLLFSICPVFVMMFRVGVESTLLLTNGLLLLYFLAKGMQVSEKKWYILAGFAGGLCLYSYALAYIALPIFLLLAVLFELWTRRTKWKMVLLRYVLLGIPLGVMAAPLIVEQLVNMLHLGTKHFGPITFPQLYQYRTGELEFGDVLAKTWKTFFYTNFWDDLLYNTTEHFGNLYFLSIPFALLGFVAAIVILCRMLRRQAKEQELYVQNIPVVLVLFWVLSQYVIGWMIGGGAEAQSSRMNGIFGALLFLVVLGIDCVDRWLGKAPVYWRRIWRYGITAAYAVSFLFFAGYYFGSYNEETYPLNNMFEYDMGEVQNTLQEYAEQTSGRSAVRNVYMRTNPMYYIVTSGMNPATIGFGEDAPAQAQNVYFNYPEKVDESGIYVVHRTESESLERLQKHGFRQIDLQNWCICISPVNDIEIQTKSQTCQIDRIDCEVREDGEKWLTILGWAYDAETLGAFAGLQLKVNGEVYDAEAMERSDVATSYGLQDVSVGFAVSLPASQLFEGMDGVLTSAVNANKAEDTLATFHYERP